MVRGKSKNLIWIAGLTCLLVACGGSIDTTSAGTASETASAKTALRSNTISSGTQPFVFSAYKDVGTAMNWWDDSGVNTYVMSTRVSSGANAALVPVVDALPPGMHAVTWAFATGDCSNENWAGISHGDFVVPNIASYTQKNIDYIVSTGGAAGGFTCSSGAAMEAFLDRYMSANFVGIDFDIEGGRLNMAQIDSLVHAIADAKATGKYPNLRVSFTLASLASTISPGAVGSSINQEGENVMSAIQAYGPTGYYINLMAMDYGDPASAGVCVVVNGLCDMGHSAVQAAENFLIEFNGTNGKAAVAPAQVELTPLIGENDIVSEVFSFQDASVVAHYVKDQHLGGLHFWSFDRDTSDCGSGGVTTTCHGIANRAPLAFSTTFAAGLN